MDLSKWLKQGNVSATVLELGSSRYFPTAKGVFMSVLETEQGRDWSICQQAKGMTHISLCGSGVIKVSLCSSLQC